MDKIREIIATLWDEFSGWVMIVAVAIGMILLALVGFSIYVVILIAFVVAIIVVYGSPRMLAGSFVVAVLLKALSEPLKQLTNIWFAGSAHDQFYIFVNSTGYIAMILLVFFLAYVLGLIIETTKSVLRSIRLVRSNTIITNSRDSD
jgi:hypothetical protein